MADIGCTAPDASPPKFARYIVDTADIGFMMRATDALHQAIISSRAAGGGQTTSPHTIIKPDSRTTVCLTPNNSSTNTQVHLYSARVRGGAEWLNESFAHETLISFLHATYGEDVMDIIGYNVQRVYRYAYLGYRLDYEALLRTLPRNIARPTGGGIPAITYYIPGIATDNWPTPDCIPTPIEITLNYNGRFGLYDDAECSRIVFALEYLHVALAPFFL